MPSVTGASAMIRACRVSTTTTAGAAALSALLTLGVSSLGAQTQAGDPAPVAIYACAVPLIGTMYLIKQPGMPEKCFGPSEGPFKHTAVSWSQKGEKGDPGVAGATGAKGDKGDPGAQGEKGVQGEKGDRGDKGDPGVQGGKGDTGETGAQGVQGAQGIQGDKGDPGAQGIPGVNGEKGDKGEKGEKGDPGAQGEKGDKGDSGAQGEKGDKGDKGDIGPAGVPCANGCVDHNSLANGVAVRRLNGLTETVTLVAGANVTITPSGQTLTISSTGGSGGSGTSTNTPNTLVQRDANGGFAAGPLTLGGKIDQTSNDGLVAIGNYGSGTIPASGAGTRLMWFPARAAFRAGDVDATQWDAANVGFYSTATGNNTVASSYGSVAMGSRTTASGDASVAMGVVTTASGAASTALGGGTTASGAYSTALGNGTKAIGEDAIAMGLGTTATGQQSTATGFSTTASGQASSAAGQFTIASGFAAVAMGQQTLAKGPSSVAMGVQTTAAGEASLATGQLSIARGQSSVAMGYQTRAGGDYSVAIGKLAQADGEGTFAFADASDASAFPAAFQNMFAVRAQHVWLGTNNNVTAPTTDFLTTSTGARLTVGGAWTNASDVNRKHLFRPAEGEWALEQLAALPIRTWSYKAESEAVRHLGPTAQDFRAAFGLGDSETSIATVDADGVSLLAAQALEARTRALREDNAALRAELTKVNRGYNEMKQAYDDLLRRVERLERVVTP